MLNLAPEASNNYTQNSGGIMRKKTTAVALAVATASLATMSASAANFIVLNTSTLNDMRLIGAANIMNIADYSSCIAPSTCGGSLNPLDPSQWTAMDKDITTTPDVAVEANNINVSGTLSLTGSSITAAVLNQLAALSWGTFQTAATTANLVAGDTSLLNVDPISGTPVKSVYSNPMVWTYNPVTNQLNHQAGGGTAATSSSIATCVTVLGGPTGSCRQFAASIDASGELGGGAGGSIANSIFNWDGLAANYIVRDGQTTPWHTATGTASTGGLQVSGAGGQAGVTWNLNGCTEASYTCTIYARVVGGALGSGTGNATAVSGLYTLQLQNTVPVPAAVWLMGGALGGLGMIRRRQKAAA